MHAGYSSCVHFLIKRSTYNVGDRIMPQGSKAKYSEKQKRKAEHIEFSYELKGVPEKAAAREDSAQHVITTKQEKSKPNAFESQTRVDLLAIARIRKISGRSIMNKQELILALRKP